MRECLPSKVRGEDMRKQLNPKERHVLYFLYNLLIGSASNGGSIHGCIGQFANGQGLPQKQIPMSCVSHLDQYFDPDKKYQSDKFRTVFNRKNKQNNVFSGLNIYKIQKHREWRENPGKMYEKELFIEYEALDVEHKLYYKHQYHCLMT